MRNFQILTIVACLVAGCASSNAESTMLSANVALISSSGGTSRDERGDIVDRALKEAANVTSAHGYHYFVVLTADNTSSTTKLVMPGDRIYIQQARNRTLGNTTFSAALQPGWSYMTPDQTITRRRPSLDIIIQMYKQGEIDPSMEGVWNAEAVRAGLGASP